jgi:hypothetical protein
MSRRVWLVLLNPDGQPLKKTSATSVFLPVDALVDDIRKAVKAEYVDSHLKGVAPSDLVVYKNKIAFDKRNDDQGKELPLEVDSSINHLGKTKNDPIIVVVPSLQNATSSAMVTPLPFFEYLKRGRIDRPDNQVLATIACRYSQQLQAVLSIGKTEPCVDLYKTVKELPSSFTRGVIEGDLNISINGPMSFGQPRCCRPQNRKESLHQATSDTSNNHDSIQPI